MFNGTNNSMNMINQIKAMLQKDMTPQSVVTDFLMQGNNNPLLGQLVEMAQSNKKPNVETFARNLLKQKGLNYDEEFAKFLSQIK